tara:strand:- start:21 stop:962 length:942 start_codon:yes stop_codon:yes gene_type:complete
MNDKFLWVERYAPQTIDDCVLPTNLKKEFLAIKEMPNALFIGQAGVGKTTVARVLCNTLNIDYMFMNASTERGIDEVRNKIDSFASTTSLMGGYKVLLLDEADNLTPDAQKALRALIEQYQNNCRFVLTCNYPYKLIDPLRSRLQEYSFSYTPNDKSIQNLFIKRLLEILSKEKVDLKREDVPVLQSLVRMYYPNWRRCIHELQRITTSGTIDPSLVSQLENNHISTLFELMKAKNFSKVREWVAENLSEGVAPQEVISQIYAEMTNYATTASCAQMVLLLAQYQHWSVDVADQEVNTVAMTVEIMMGAEWLN